MCVCVHACVTSFTERYIPINFIFHKNAEFTKRYCEDKENVPVRYKFPPNSSLSHICFN